MFRRLVIILAYASFIAAESTPAFTGTAQRFVAQELRSSSPVILKTDSYQSSSPVQSRTPNMSNNMKLSDSESSHSIPALRGDSESESNSYVVSERSSGFSWMPVGGENGNERASSHARMAPRTDNMGFSSIPIGRPASSQ
eukprot:385833-Rhodomonas_salina.3